MEEMGSTEVHRQEEAWPAGRAGSTYITGVPWCAEERLEGSVGAPYNRHLPFLLCYCYFAVLPELSYSSGYGVFVMNNNLLLFQVVRLLEAVELAKVSVSQLLMSHL